MKNAGYLERIYAMMKDMGSPNWFSLGTQKLSRTEFRLLQEVVAEREKGQDIISSELARRLGVTRSAISQIVAKMEERDIIVRVPSPTDRKIAYVRLSEKSLSMFEECCRHANEVINRVVEKLGDEKMEALLQANAEFVAVLKDVRAEMGTCKK